MTTLIYVAASLVFGYLLTFVFDTVLSSLGNIMMMKEQDGEMTFVFKTFYSFTVMMISLSIWGLMGYGVVGLVRSL